MEERRKSNRRELTSKLIIKRLGGVDVDETVEIDITDVSKTGIGFTCSKALEIGAVYESYLRIWTQEVLHAFLEIVRIEKRDSVFSYGGIFIGKGASLGRGERGAGALGIRPARERGRDRNKHGAFMGADGCAARSDEESRRLL